MIILQNEWIRASIAPLGAELQSLQNKTTGIDHMWSGDGNYWAKHSPVLFPIVGTLIDDTYFYNNEAYKLSRHGFAREKVFATQQINEAEVVFTLSDDADTRKVFPFEFVLQIRYLLQGTSCSCSYEISNPSQGELSFSIGAHPAFALPFVSNSSYTDHYLQFNQPEELRRFKLDNGLISGLMEVIPTQDNRILLNHSLFYDDAIVLKNLKSDRITLASDKHPHGIHFQFNDYPFFGIWAAKDAPFICLEPWYGIADSIHHNQQLTEKEGIVQLPPGGTFERSWKVTCF